MITSDLAESIGESLEGGVPETVTSSGAQMDGLYVEVYGNHWVAHISLHNDQSTIVTN